MKNQRWCILTPKATYTVAEGLRRHLLWHFSQVDVCTEVPEDNYDKYIVLCAQVFKTKFPPIEKTIIYQLEQCTGVAWRKDYLKRLQDAPAIIDYTLPNIEHLKRKGIDPSKVWHVPLSANPLFLPPNRRPNKQHDFMFYGCVGEQRRASFLYRLMEKFDVNIVQRTFFDELREEMLNSKIVVNIHYYNRSVLETCRINECLSFGTPVLSESSQDAGDYPELSSAVRYFEEGDIDGMLVAAEEMISNIPSHEDVKYAVESSSVRSYMKLHTFLEDGNYI